MVQVASEASVRVTITTLTSQSADMNIDHGDNSCSGPIAEGFAISRGEAAGPSAVDGADCEIGATGTAFDGGTDCGAAATGPAFDEGAGWTAAGGADRPGAACCAGAATA